MFASRMRRHHQAHHTSRSLDLLLSSMPALNAALADSQPVDLYPRVKMAQEVLYAFQEDARGDLVLP